MAKFKIFIAPFLIILTGVLIALLIIFLPQIQITKKNDFKLLSSQEVGEKILEYFNSHLLKDRDKATLIETKEESGVYRFKLKVAEEEFETFATRDGKFLFVGFAELTQVFK